MQEQRIDKYNKYVVAEDFLLVSNYNNIMELPTFLRAVINTTSKEYLTERKQSINALAACFLLSGQKSIPTRARKSIAGFKLREGALLGCRTTLRKKKLYTIIDKLLVFALPRLYSENGNKITSRRDEKQSFTSSKEGNNTLLRLASKAEQVKHTFTLKRHSNLYSARESSILNQSHSEGTETLSREEGYRLSINLGHVKKNNSKNKEVAKENRKQVKLEVKLRFSYRFTSSFTSSFTSRREGQLDHLALGIKDLLLMPELQEFLPLFEPVRGINLGVSFSNPRIKGTSLVANFIANIQKKKRVLEILQHPEVFRKKPKDINGMAKGKRVINPAELTHIAPNYNSVSHEETNCLLTLPFAKCFGSTMKKRLEKKSWYDSQDIESKALLFEKKGLFQNQNLKREHTLLVNAFCTSSDTSFAKVLLESKALLLEEKENQKVLFLTSFQYPKQYN